MVPGPATFVIILHWIWDLKFERGTGLIWVEYILHNGHYKDVFFTWEKIDTILGSYGLSQNVKNGHQVCLTKWK
jgi:hypothetical protein